MRIVITGFPNHGPYLARLLCESAPGVCAEYFPDSRWSVLKAAAHALSADAYICFGGPHTKEIVQKICNARSVPVVLLWAGSDVLTIANNPSELERLRLSNVVHWAVATHLVNELAELGIDTRYVNVAGAVTPKALAPMPPTFTVLTYLPAPRRDFYGQAAVWEVARALSDVRFIAVGAGEREPDAPPNVEYLGYVDDIDGCIDGASVVLRLTPHDGLARGVIEALARGRHAIWTYELPGVTQVSSTLQAIDELIALRQAHLENRLEFNKAGIEYAAAFHQPEEVALEIIDALQDAIRARSQQPATAARPMYRLAISGHELYATRVAQNCAKYCPQFSTSVLTTRSRSTAVISVLELLASNAWYTIGEPQQPRAFELAAALSCKRRIIHWLGSEVALLHGNRTLVNALKTRRYRHLAQSESVVSELETFGIDAELVPVPAALTPAQICNLPKRFTLLVYLPHEQPEFYGRYQYERLMSGLSGEDIHYIIVGGGRIEVPAGVSAERIPWRPDLSNVYDKSTALIRFTQPDSVSMMVVEALLHGRYVLWSNDFPFVTRVHDSHDLEYSVRALLKQHVEGTLEPQLDAAQAIKRLYSPERGLVSLSLSTPGATG